MRLERGGGEFDLKEGCGRSRREKHESRQGTQGSAECRRARGAQSHGKNQEWRFLFSCGPAERPAAERRATGAVLEPMNCAAVKADGRPKWLDEKSDKEIVLMVSARRSSIGGLPNARIFPNRGLPKWHWAHVIVARSRRAYPRRDLFDKAPPPLMTDWGADFCDRPPKQNETTVQFVLSLQF